MKKHSAEIHRNKTVTRAIHRLFWQANAQHKGYLFLNQLCNIPALAIINVFVPVQVAYGIQAILVRNFDMVQHQAWVVLVSSLVGAATFALGTWANHRCVVLGGEYVQRKVFANYLNKDYDFYANRHIGALGSDAVELRNSYGEYTLLIDFDIMKTLIVIFVGLGVILYQSLLLGLVTTVFVALIFLSVVFAAGFRLRYRRMLSAASSKLAGKIGDPLSHGVAVKSFAQEEYEQSRLDEPLEEWKQAQLKTFDTSIPQSVLRNILLAISMMTLLLLSAHLYKTNAISIASVVLVQLYITRIVNTAVDVNVIIKKYEALMSAAHEPMATMLLPNDVTDRAEIQTLPEQASHQIAFKAVSYQYPNVAKSKLAIKDFSLTVAPGEKIGVVGYSGGGKTTLTKLLLRFMDVTNGSIELGGIDIRDLSQHELRQKIAYVPQEPLLFHRSIKENIAYARPEASDKVIQTVSKVAYVDDFVKDLPEKYDAMVGERGVKLSGGQRQRVAVARALLKDAPILVLDEATSALDSQSEKYIQKALWQLMRGRTAIVIAHRLSTIQHMDRIVVMDQGRIVQTGTHQELLKDKKGIYARLWSHQSGGYLQASPQSGRSE
jgi:ATP-binding cassette subfamily B protein